jgi:pimeloyl-ACP methyl ester carboxylesterase
MHAILELRRKRLIVLQMADIHSSNQETLLATDRLDLLKWSGCRNLRRAGLLKRSETMLNFRCAELYGSALCAISTPRFPGTLTIIMSTYLLIHGAWHGGWCWRKVVPLLEAKGHKVLAPDWPGHGDDKTPAAAVTLKSYTDRICEFASTQTEPVVLAGHSMGGIAITQAAERCEKRIRALVYVCAYLPRNGDSLKTWALQDLESRVTPSTMDPRADGTVGFKPEYSREAFYGNCSDEDVAFTQSRLVAEPGGLWETPVETTASRWGQIPRYYVECARDRAITLELQREMQEHSPCRQTFSIDTDYSPFLSAPEQLADIPGGLQ